MEWIRHDLQSAREVQRHLLPSVAPEWGGVRMVAHYRPAYEIGGDFYDVVEQPGGRLLALVGDVAGKGISAALLMARVSGEFQRLAGEGRSPREILGLADRWVTRAGHSDRFVTALCVQLDLGRQPCWTIANAGHPAPFFWRKGAGSVPVGEPSGPPLGMTDLGSGRYDEEVIPARPGDVMLLSTDGVTEALRGRGQFSYGDLEDRAQSECTDLLGHIDRTLLACVEAVQRDADDAAWLGLELTEKAFNLTAIAA
jgi:serine phosphatase RsbU (regulator of sigma subunit)